MVGAVPTIVEDVVDVAVACACGAEFFVVVLAVDLFAATAGALLVVGPCCDAIDVADIAAAPEVRTPPVWFFDEAFKIAQLKVKEKFPELSDLLNEMPVANAENACADICSYDLSDYYKSLEAILTKYKLEHPDR